jgi:hypothetical protein
MTDQSSPLSPSITSSPVVGDLTYPASPPGLPIPPPLPPLNIPPILDSRVPAPPPPLIKRIASPPDLLTLTKCISAPTLDKLIAAAEEELAQLRDSP